MFGPRGRLTSGKAGPDVRGHPAACSLFTAGDLEVLEIPAFGAADYIRFAHPSDTAGDRPAVLRYAPTQRRREPRSRANCPDMPIGSRPDPVRPAGLALRGLQGRRDDDAGAAPVQQGTRPAGRAIRDSRPRRQDARRKRKAGAAPRRRRNGSCRSRAASTRVLEPKRLLMPSGEMRCPRVRRAAGRRASRRGQDLRVQRRAAPGRGPH